MNNVRSTSNPADRKRLCATVHGYVQGVGYRYFTLSEARRAGVKGWVRNDRSGTVQVVAEGDVEALMQLLAALRSGPSGAAVERVDTRWENPTGEFHSFEIRY